MNQYHIYEEIGRSKHSTVYKGRKKKTIEYFAIKSVDKSQRPKVIQEVRILHSLDHTNVLKFYEWYETSAHLWLVLEYCVGGDLMTLLKQDCRLPEESIHDIGRDLVYALQFLHSEGIIYCDLKPSNILLDENGRVKLPQAKRGTPCYMAPELFQEGGVHSYASDLWALGCVLYECYTGKPPFVADEFTALVESILSDPVPTLPDSPSKPFCNLVNHLLVKDPAERIQWSELCGHGFWRTKFRPLSLPPQPAFNIMVDQSRQSCLSERNVDRPPSQKASHYHGPKHRDGTIRHDENSVSATKAFEVSSKSPPNSKKLQTKGSIRVVEKRRDASTTTKGANILRLSRIAKKNLQRENDNENYRRPLPKASERDNDVKIENNDMELDFGEHNDEEAQDNSDESEISVANSPLPNTPMPLLPRDNEKDGELSKTPNKTSFPPDIGENHEEESCPLPAEVATTTPAIGQKRATRNVLEMHKMEAGATEGSDSSKSINNLSQVLWHPSDLSVRPIMPSRKTEKAQEAMPPLPFIAMPVTEFLKLSPEKLDELLSRIATCLTGSASPAEKQNTIKYLEILSAHPDAANILTNSSIMLVLVKLLRLSKASGLRVHLVSVIGLLIRHSTSIEADLASSGIIRALADSLGDKQEKVRRYAMAALGELVFYIATQNENCSRDCGGLASPAKDGRSTPSWQVSGPVFALISSILRKGEDDTTQLYALRTIENVCSQGSDWAARFTSQEVIANLCYIFKAVGKQESIRLTAGSCLVRLVRFSPPSIQSVLDKLSFKDITSGLAKENPREQQISINLLNMAMLGSHMFSNMGRHLMSLSEDKLLVPVLISLVEQGSEVLRGKAFILAALLCRSGRRWLPVFCSGKLLSIVDRLAKEKGSYVQQCVEAFVQVVAGTVPGILETVASDIQQQHSGKRHGQTGMAGRTHPKINVHLFSVILHLLGSFAFKKMVANNRVLEQLVVFLKLVESSAFQAKDDFQITLLRVLESVTMEASTVLEHSEIFISKVLPSLSILYKGNKDGDARFLCLKIIFDLIVVFLNEMPSPSEHQNDQTWKELKSICETHFLPLYPMLVEDEDPIPAYAQKLLVMLLEFNFAQVSDILHLKMVSQCFEFLLSDLSCANVNNVKLCLSLASAPEMETKILSELTVVRRIGNLLEFVNAKQMEDFLEPTLGLCKAFIMRGRGGRITNQMKDLSLVNDAAAAIGSFYQHQCIGDIADFGCNMSAFLDLSGSNEANIADLASECVILLLKVASREATTGLLTSASTVTTVLESCCLRCQGPEMGVYALVLQRLLHALSLACQEYRSQAMILSISGAEITKIETLASNLRSSTIPCIADAASGACLELRRLPRCA
ncbi:Serine/threonine-protein kinase RUNKEL [Nymphaea thermarum]|nr:Serine/threonine-protein kinase RUNKEL [Nymphaea thermarum]